MNAIEISSLKKTYDTGDQALKGIDLNIKQGHSRLQMQVVRLTLY